MNGVLDFGIAFLLAVEMVLGIWGWPGAARSQAVVAGGAATVLGLLLFAGRAWLRPNLVSPSRRMQATAQRAGALVRGLFSGLWAACGQLVAGVTSLLEGQAGILWGLLLLALFASLIVSGNP